MAGDITMKKRIAIGVALAVGTFTVVTTTRANTFTVTNVNDTGTGSFRQAIIDANAHIGLDTIAFNIPGTGLHTIIPATVWPTITDPVIIDGYTQPGSSPNTLATGDNSVHRIELNGNGAAFPALTLTAGNSTLRGLVMNRFNGNGPANALNIQTGGNNRVVGCFFGISADGTTAQNNSRLGIDIESSPNNTIGGTNPGDRNVISGSASATSIQINGPASSGTLIQGNYIGTNAPGTAAITGSVIGIQIGNNGAGTGSSNNTIGGTTAAARNVISGNVSVGIKVFDDTITGTLIQGNYIGTNAAGTAAIPNGDGVFLLRSYSVLVGGTTAGAGNVISGNTGTGVNFANGGGVGGKGNTIQGNRIGTNTAGTAAIGNDTGIAIADAQNNLIGGTVAGAGNVISGNKSFGIFLAGGGAPDADANLIQGNFIGTNAAGTAKLGNGLIGILVSGQGSVITGVNTIGGTTAAARNIISGNGQYGLQIIGGSHLRIQGNFIGTDVNGTGALGNSLYAIYMSHSLDNQIGGTTPGSGNVIAFNGSPGTAAGGVSVLYDGTGNSILGNSIFSNVGLGINLGANDTVEANDVGDADTGPNNLQNYPVLTTVSNGGGQTNIVGTLNSEANKTYRLEFFSNSSVDPTGYGEGQTFLTAINVNTNTSGDASFNFNVPQLAPGQHVTATATDPAGNTSEFSGANGQLTNISTRLNVLTGDKVLIGGFIINGTDPKSILVRGLGPTLQSFGVSNYVHDPTLSLTALNGTNIATNDNWQDSQAAAISATGLAPPSDAESAILQTLVPGKYTAILAGKNNTTGVGLVEVYDRSPNSNSALANISTRGFVDIGSSVMIGGFITDNGIRKLIIRALGPTLAQFGVTNVLQNPMVSVHDANGTEIASNDDWQSSQQAEIQASGFAPPNPKESAVVITRPTGNTTAIVSGVGNTTGNALVEVYILPQN